jgi:ribonuclease Z
MRELVVLGTASQVPTRTRNHNGYVLRWDDEMILFDPGEGSQRQMLHANVAVTPLTRVCVTHFHGDHSLGLAGVIQRISLDRVPHPVVMNFPAGGSEYFERLRHATSYWNHADLAVEPVGPGFSAETSAGRLTALPLRHSIETYGYRLVEPDSRRMVPELLDRHGIAGPAVGELQRAGRLGDVRLADVSAPRPGQSFAFVMDTRLCDAVYELAAGVDMLVIESTFLDSDIALAERYGHLTAGQAATVAQECGVRTLVLTHFSQRYSDPEAFRQEAAEWFEGDVVVAEDLMRVPVPSRNARRPSYPTRS